MTLGFPVAGRPRVKQVPGGPINNMVRSAVDRVAYFALYSRILVFVMQIFFNYLMPDHEAKDVFNPPNIHRIGRLDWWMGIIFSGFKRWDSIYFLHIAEYGYTYENTVAFFPLYPMAVRLLANSLFFPLQQIMNYPTVLLISAVALNFYFFVKSAKALYLLSENVLGDETLALKTAQLYCINPASIFFSAAYSEATFAFFTFSGLLELERSSPMKSSLCFGLSSLARSNGIVNVGFLMYRKFMDLIKSLRAVQWNEMIDMKTILITIWSSIFIYAIPAVFYGAVCLLPFAAFQAFGYFTFCNKDASYKDLPTHILNYGNDKHFKMPHGGLSPWCQRSLPLPYSYVQATHWNNGLLKYYEFKQLPNFLLAAPMIVLCTSAIFFYLRHNIRHLLSGIGQNEFYKKYDEEKTEQPSPDAGFYSPRIFVYIVHVFALLLVAVLFMHIQVTTRFIACASPVVYWFVATTTTPPDQLRPKGNPYDIRRPAVAAPSAANGDHHPPKSALDMDIVDWDKTNFASKVIFIYFHLYFFVGVAAFSNFLPWT